MYDDKDKVAKTMVAPQIRDVWTITNIEGNTFEVNDKVNIGRGEDNEVCIDVVSYTHLQPDETPEQLVCRRLLQKKKVITMYTARNWSEIRMETQ